MNIGSTQPQIQTGQTPAPASVENKSQQLQMLLLKKSLDGQQQQADELTREMEGKGQLIDLRV
ncbi:MAG TPA: hypothetical protein VGL56_20620 [Fimbriimonadaceae bacterium]|jgi:hypothetical protein